MFKELNKSVIDLYNMCEFEKRSEFCEGVVETLENAVCDFKKQIHKMKIEEE